MANVQKYFEEFHQKIAVDIEMKEKLREKRDIVLDRIRDHLKENGHPTFTRFMQGSYRMGTGIQPLEGQEFDIDTGLRFDLGESPDITKAKEVRTWIFDAVDGHTKKVEAKGPCIRVTYRENGVEAFHLDLVAYAVWEAGDKDEYRLAHSKDGWVEADPPTLLEKVKEAREPFSDDAICDSKTKTDQFRRVVRYLRRWNDFALPGEQDGKPTGLALVLLCRDRLSRTASLSGCADDRKALEDLAWEVKNLSGRLTTYKPTPQYEDMYARLTEDEMTQLKARFATLYEALVEADTAADPVVACEALQKVFGPDFPVPDPKDTAKASSAPAIITSSTSG